MIVLSLFDGMGCGYEALKRAGIKVDKYYASEIDKYAITIANKNHPDIIQLGDIEDWEDWDEMGMEKPDLIMGGSPCQGFSFAGKGLNFSDPRSKLFFVMDKIIKYYKPEFRLLENVRMKAEHLKVLSEYMECIPMFINSSLVSAQNRQRYYWFNWEVDQPEDRKIYLPDIIQEGVVDRDKSYCLDANYWKGTTVEQYIKKCRRQIVFTERRTEEAKRIRKEFREKYGRDFSPRRGKELVARDDGKMNCLTATYSLKEHTLIDEKLYYRKLTPLECERLQTLPDGYTEALERLYYSLYNSEVISNKERYGCNTAQSNIVIGKSRQTGTGNYALNIIREWLGTEQQTQDLKLNYKEILPVSIVIEKSEKKVAEQGVCVIDTTKTGLEKETLYTQIKNALNSDQGGTRKELMVKTSTGKYMRIISEGNYSEPRLYIMLIVTKLIIELKICTYVHHKANMQFCIRNLKDSQGNLSRVVISNFEMETIKSLVSNTQRYKMLGNGWTVEVLTHIFKGMK